MMKVNKLFNLTENSYKYLNAGKVYSAEEQKAAKQFIKNNNVVINSNAYTSPFKETGAAVNTMKSDIDANANIQYAIAHGVPAQQATKMFIA